MNSLTALSTSIRNISAVIDAWVKPLESSPTPDWEALERAAGILARLMQIEKTIIALDRNPQLADKRYLKQLCDAIARLHALGKVWNQTRELEIKLSPLPKLNLGAPASLPAGPGASPPPIPSAASEPDTPSSPTAALVAHQCNADIPVCDSSVTKTFTPLNPLSNAGEVARTPAGEAPALHSAAHRSVVDPLKVFPANLNPPAPRSPLYSIQSYAASPPLDSSQSEPREFCSPQPASLDPNPSTLDPSSAIPTVRSINLLANWHKTLTDPELFTQIHNRVNAIALQLRDFFIEIGDPPYSKTFPHLEHTGIPIIHFTFTPPSPPGTAPPLPATG